MECVVKIACKLKSKPKVDGRTKGLCQPERRIRGNTSSAIDDLVDANARNAHRLCKCRLSQPERLHELLNQHRSRASRSPPRWDKDISLNGSRQFQFPVLLGPTRQNKPDSGRSFEYCIDLLDRP